MAVTILWLAINYGAGNSQASKSTSVRSSAQFMNETYWGEHALSQAVYQSLTILPGHIQLKLESQPLWKKLQIDFISERGIFLQTKMCEIKAIPTSA